MHSLLSIFSTRSLPDSKPIEMVVQFVSLHQSFEQVWPLTHGVGAPGRPVGPGLVRLARILLEPLVEPARLLEEHRVVNHHRAERPYLSSRTLSSSMTSSTGRRPMLAI